MAANPGNLLEDFSEALLNSVKGFIVRYKRGKAIALPPDPYPNPENDYDLIIHNTSRLFQEFGNYILVECKDWDKGVGYPEIAKFLHKLHSRKCTTGIIIAMENVIYKDFNPTLRRAYDQDGIIVIVMDKDDISNILAGKINIATLIRKNYERGRFGLN